MINFAYVCFTRILSGRFQAGEGDILIFMTGQEDIEVTSFLLRERWEIVPRLREYTVSV